MTSLYLAAQVREIDRITIDERRIPGLTLMRRAADACVSALIQRWPEPAKEWRSCAGRGTMPAMASLLRACWRIAGVQTSVGLVGRMPEA